jgi:hypothetical protein
VLAEDNDEWACQTLGHNGNALVVRSDLSDPGATAKL